MGKSLKELLDTFPFENGLNPRGVGPGTIKPEPSDRFTNDNKDAKDWLKATPKLYGTDVVRIMTQTDPHETKKAVKKAANKIGGAIGGNVGAVIGVAASKIAEFHPKFPDDWTNDADAPTKMEPYFYSGIINGDYARGHYYNAYHKNSKSKLGQFLQTNKTPEQIKNAILPALKSAAIAAATGLITKGVTKLISNRNKKKGKEGSPIPQKKERPNNGFFTKDKFNKPFFPSSLLINDGYGESEYGLSYRNYSALTQRGGNIGAISYLDKDGVSILSDVSPTTDVSQFRQKDTAKGISDYYGQVFRNNTPQTRNEGNVIVSANMFQNNYKPINELMFVDPTNGGTYTTDRNAYADGRSLNDKVQNYSKFVDADGNAFISFGIRNSDGSYSDNDIDKGASLNLRYGITSTSLLDTIDTSDETNYKFPYKSIGGLDVVARWNTKEEPFSKSKETILAHTISFLQSANQTQYNASEKINPYLEKKKNILENKDEDIVRVSIGGIKFLATVTNLSDKNTSNWDSVKPIGSGVNFYLFNNWERSISFDLILYAENRSQLDLIWKKVDDVTTFTTGRPSGKAGAGYGVYGNIVRLQLGNLINENGFINDITMNVDSNSVWEIDKGQQLPFVCTISVSFQVVTNLEGDEYTFYTKKDN